MTPIQTLKTQDYLASRFISRILFNTRLVSTVANHLKNVHEQVDYVPVQVESRQHILFRAQENGNETKQYENNQEW